MAEESLLWKMGLRTAEFDSGLEGATARISAFGDKFQAAISVVAGGAVIGFFQKVVDKAGEIQDTADALQITTDSVQALDYAATQAGVSVDQLHAVFGTIAAKSADAAAGNKEVIDSLDKLGINAAEFVKQPVDRQLEMIAKGAAAAQDKAAAFGAVVDLIGQRNAPKLNAVLQQLASEGLDGVTESAKQMGQVMSEDTVSSLDGLGDRLATLGNVAITVGGTVLNSFLKIGEILGEGAANYVNIMTGTEPVYLVAQEGQKKVAAAVDTVTAALRGTKASLDEVAKATEAQAKANDQANYSNLSGLEKIQVLQDKILKLRSDLKSYDEGTKESLKIQGELTDTIVKLNEEWKKQSDIIAKNDEASAEARRAEQDAAAQTLSLNDQKKRLLDQIKAKQAEIASGELDNLDVTQQIKDVEQLRSNIRKIEAEQANNEVEIAKLLLKGVDNLTDAEKQRLAILQGQTTEAATQAEIHQLLSRGVENLTDDEKARLAVLVGQTAEIRKQIALVTNTPQPPTPTNTPNTNPPTPTPPPKKETADGSGPLGLHDLSTTSTASLQAALKQLQDQLDKAVAEQNAAPVRVGNPFNIAVNWSLESQINSIKDELSFRQGFTQAYNTRGEAGALQYYTMQGGDALSFDNAFANMNAWGQGLDALSKQGKDTLDTLAGIKAALDKLTNGG